MYASLNEKGNPKIKDSSDEGIVLKLKSHKPKHI